MVIKIIIALIGFYYLPFWLWLLCIGLYFLLKDDGKTNTIPKVKTRTDGSVIKKDPVVTAKSYDEYRGIVYKVMDNRVPFHNELTSPFSNGNLDNTVAMCKRENGRIVGAYMYFTSEKLRDNRERIRNGQIKRNDEARKKAQIPGRDLVRGRFSEFSDGRKIYHYHATHLIPFRLCLVDGEFGDLMFMGTAALNAGKRAEFGFEVSSELANKRAVEIYNKSLEAYDAMTYNYFTHDEELDAPEDNMYTLDDFERAIDLFIRDKRFKYDTKWKYGVECFYLPENNGVIPDYVEVFLHNTEFNKRLIHGRIWNRL